MNKKAFTLVEMLAVIIILAIITSLAVVGYTTYLKSSRDKSFKVAEKSFKTALEEAYTDCLGNNPNNAFCSNHDEVYKVNDMIYLSELVNDNYIEPIKNPYNTEKDCDKDKSYISVLGESDYKVCLICGNNKSESCNK